MAEIDHVVVLALENRSFDHMLGLLPHPDPAFDGLLHGGPYHNPGWGDAPAVIAGPGAKPVIPVGPDHGHDSVMAQLGIAGARPPWRPTNTGFVRDYERTCQAVPYKRYRGLLSPIFNWRAARKLRAAPHVAGRGPLVMLSHAADAVPVLSRLAMEFAVCTRWFASVPGETWPNRNFLHAATSDGETNIDNRFYDNPTIFELLETAGRTWHIYHDDTPQVWAFKSLWDTEERHANWFQFSAFPEHAAAGELPAYSFIEPNHRPPLHELDHDPIVGRPDVSDNQHPENNLVSDAAYDAFSSTDTDFARGEKLLATVYEALRANPDLFQRTLLLITYDEHGGFFDHVRPPVDVPAPTVRPMEGAGARILHFFLERNSRAFDFTMLGVRVPAIVVSPLVPRGTVDSAVRDHASVPATLRALFAPEAPALTRRDAWSQPFHGVASLAAPRTDMPDLSALAGGPAAAASTMAAAPQATPPPSAGADVPDYYRSFVDLAGLVDGHLKDVGEPEAAVSVAAAPADQAAQVSALFSRAAERHRSDRAARELSGTAVKRTHVPLRPENA